MQRRPVPRRGVDEDGADADAAVILSDELAGDVAERQLVDPMISTSRVLMAAAV